jgi:hypothetical protein
VSIQLTEAVRSIRDFSLIVKQQKVTKVRVHSNAPIHSTERGIAR